ncbi:hypothetical protein [Lysinibacillus sphaericus]|nr:hypothetical protein [Lysinibacillus sphaericus]
MFKQLKRKHVINQLNKLEIHNIDGQPLEDVLYTTLLKTLALKRAKN